MLISVLTNKAVLAGTKALTWNVVRCGNRFPRGRRTGEDGNGHGAAPSSQAPTQTRPTQRPLLLGHVVITGVEILLALGQPLLEEGRVAATCKKK